MPMSKKLLLNPFVRVYPDLHGGLFVLENGLNGERVAIGDLQIIEILQRASKPILRNHLARLFTPLDEHKGKQFFRTLLDKGFLLETSSEILAVHKDFISKYNWQDFFLAIKEGERDKNKINKRLVADVNRKIKNELSLNRQEFFNKLLRRRTTRNFNGVPLSKKSLRGILSDGIDFYRSLGGCITDTRHIRLFIVILRVDNLERGVYEYDYVRGHLRAIVLGDFENNLQQIIAGQGFMKGCSFAMLVTADVDQLVGKFGVSYADLIIEVGKLSHGVLVAATQSKLGVFQTPAMIDSKVRDLLKTSLFIDDAFYILGIGHKTNRT